MLRKQSAGTIIWCPKNLSDPGGYYTRASEIDPPRNTERHTTKPKRRIALDLHCGRMSAKGGYRTISGETRMELTRKARGAEMAAGIVGALVGDHLAEKYKAVDGLSDPNLVTDLQLLRTLLLKAIREDFYVGREAELDDPEVNDTRSWLLGALAQISGEDKESTELLVAHLDSQTEPSQWARYWSLEGLIRGGNPQVPAIAKNLADRVQDPMVSMLATAYFGSRRDAKAIRKIRESLGNTETQWFALRAVRVVPLPSAVQDVCKIVDIQPNIAAMRHTTQSWRWAMCRAVGRRLPWPVNRCQDAS
jgi:hypothetical protein